jgi:hypothetical protein
MKFSEFVKKYEHLNHNYIAYNSASCKQDDIRFRMVFNLDRPVHKKEFLHFWTNLNRMYDNIFDKQTNYLTKTNALPRHFEGAFNFMREIKGNVVCVNSVKDAYPFIPQTQKVELPDDYYKYKLKKSNIYAKTTSWYGLNDCPFTQTNNVQTKIRNYQAIMNLDGSNRFNEYFKLMMSIASTASKMGYSITETELKRLMVEIDASQWDRARGKENSHKKSLTRAINNAKISAR